MYRDGLYETIEHLAIARTPNDGRRLGAVHHTRIPVIHDGCPDRPPLAPPARPSHAFEYALVICLTLAEPDAILNFKPEELDASACVLFGVVTTSALAARLDLASAPLFGEPGEPGFERPAAGVVVYKRGVDAEGVADPEDFEVGFEGVADEDGRRGALRCKNSEEMGLDLGEGSRGHCEACFRYA